MRSPALLGIAGNFNSVLLMSKRSVSGLSGELPHSLRKLREVFLELPVGCETLRGNLTIPLHLLDQQDL